MKNIYRKIIRNRKIILIPFIIIGFGLFFISTNLVLAATTAEIASNLGSIASSGLGYAVAGVIGFIALLITSVVGLLITLVIQVLISVAQFNNIIGVDAVSKGWTIVRDLCNMFFILILLVIAFAVILRVESYNLKKTLPKLLIMAVLINFSKTICGLLIDFSQVIMLTFASGFSNGSGYFIEMFNTQSLLKIPTWSRNTNPITNWDTAVASIGGVIASIITLIVLVVMLAVLVMRIIMLWIYVILSPFAFLAAAFPDGQKYFTQWWGEFTKQLIVGPALAFFIWLALTTIKTSSEKLMPGQGNTLCAGINAFFCNVDFQRFILAIGFLIGGLMITQQMGGIAGSIAGKGMQWARKTPLALGKAGMFASSWGARKFNKSKYGFQVNPFEIVRGFREGLKERKAKDILAGEKRSKELLEKGGVRGLLGGLGAGKDWTNSYINGIMNWRGFQQMGSTLTHGTGWRNKRFSEREDLVKQKESYLDVFGSQKEKDLAIKKLEQKKSKINEFEKQEARLQTDMDLEKDPKKRLELFKQKEDMRKQKEAQRKEVDNELYGYNKEDGTRVRGLKEKEINPEKQILNEQIKTIDKELRKYMAPRGFEGRAAMRQLVNEEKKKIADVKNDDELISYLENAFVNQDKYRAIAIMEKLTQDGNENEYLNHYNYESNSVGLAQFVKEKLIKELGMHEGEALSVQNDISYLAEGNNHWEMARTVNADASGSLRSMVKQRPDGTWDDTLHAQAAFAEIMKMDPQTLARSLNRLGYGGERMREDGSGRDFMISRLGLMLTKALSDSTNFVKNHSNRFNLNASQNLADEDAVKLMIEIGVKDDFISMVKKQGRAEGGAGERISPENYAKKIESVADRLEIYQKKEEDKNKKRGSKN